MTTAATVAKHIQISVRAQVPSWALAAGMDLLAAALIVSRRPEAITNPQFYAEDGHIFYQQAYMLGGWQALLTPYSGYLHIVPRLVAWASLLVPLGWAPLIFSLAALTIQAAPVAYWLSDRCSACVPDLRLRSLIAFIWIALPLSWEITLRLYTAQWHLSILAFLVVVAAMPATTWRAAVVDGVLVALAAFTSPAVPLLLPLGLVRWWREGRLKLKWDWWQIPFAVLAMGVLTQGAIFVLGGHSTRGQAPIGATPDRLALIAVNHIILPDLFGGRLTTFAGVALPSMAPLILVLAIYGAVPLIAALWRGPFPLRLLILYGVGIAALGIVSPMTDGHAPAAAGLAVPQAGARYFVVLQVAWLITLLWLTIAPGRGARVRGFAGAALLACTLLLAIPVDWRAPVDPDLHFAVYATRFAQMPRGASIAIPINPRVNQSSYWTLYLARR